MAGVKKASKKDRIKSLDKTQESVTADAAEAGMPEMSGNHSDLRRRAEEMLLKEHVESDNISLVDMRHVVHELRVHQIELEM